MRPRKHGHSGKHRFEESLEEVEATCEGRLVWIFAEYAAEGEIASGCKATHWSPEEPASFTVSHKTFVRIRVVGQDTDEQLPDSPKLAAWAANQLHTYTDRPGYIEHMEEQIWTDLEAAEEAARDAWIDRKIDERDR